MLCPTCPTERLVITERRGIEIDYCPKCRGVWLDRGELDKLIEVSASVTAAAAVPAGTYSSPPPASPPSSQPSPRQDRDDDDDDRDWSRRTDADPKKKRRGGFLGDLFEF